MSWSIGEADKSKLLALLHRMPVGVSVKTGSDGSETVWVREFARGGGQKITSIRLEKDDQR